MVARSLGAGAVCLRLVLGLCARRPREERPSVRGRAEFRPGVRVGPTWDLGPVGPEAMEQWP